MERAAGNQIELARQLSAYATLLQEADEYAAAMRLSNEAMVIVEGSGQKMNTVTFAVLYGRVELLRSVGDAASALAAAETLLDRAAASGNPEFIGTTQRSRAEPVARSGSSPARRNCWRPVTSRLRNMRIRSGNSLRRWIA